MIHPESQFKKIKRGKELHGHHQSSSHLSNSALQERTDWLFDSNDSFSRERFSHHFDGQWVYPVKKCISSPRPIRNAKSYANPRTPCCIFSRTYKPSISGDIFERSKLEARTSFFTERGALARICTAELFSWTLFKVGLGISRTNADSQWNPVYNVFHRNFCCGNEQFVGSFVHVILTRQTCGQRSSRKANAER